MTRLSAQGEPVETWGDKEHPEGFIRRNASHHIVEVTHRWRVHTRWWEARQTVWREYLKVLTDDGMLCVVFRDLQQGDWFLARIYD